MSSLKPIEQLDTLTRAKYPLLYIISWEERRIEDMLRQVAVERRKQLYLWTLTDGIVHVDAMQGNGADPSTRNPLSALDYIGQSKEAAIFVLKDFHPFMDSQGGSDHFVVVRKMRDVLNQLKESRKTLVILSPVLQFPTELEKDITVLDYSMPTLADLSQSLERVVHSAREISGMKLNVQAAHLERVLHAARGLTCTEAENVFAKSLVMKHALDIDVIISEKEQLIRRSQVLEYFQAVEDFSDVGGMDLLKQWLAKRSKAFSAKARAFGLPEPKGLLLLGVQGAGKSLLAKAVASQWHLPLLRLDLGRVFSELVGSSENNIRSALQLAESVAPCLSGDTRIMLADGSERTLKNLYEDDTQTNLSVLGMTEQFQLKPVQVKAITRRPASDLYQISLRHGVLQATSNHLHPVMRDGSLIWTRTDLLQFGDHIAIQNRMRFWQNQSLSETKDRVDVIPIGQKLRQVRQQLGLGRHKFKHTCSSLISNYERNLIHPNRSCLDAVVKEMKAWANEYSLDLSGVKEIEDLLEASISWSPVQAIEPMATPQYVYDLVCETPHTFIANGVVTHNCVLWIDEIEKGLGGVASSHNSDAGTTARIFASILTWMQEKESPVFVISTANDITMLPPEMLRKGRFDEIFFVDLPQAKERRDIFAIHLAQRGRDPLEFDLDQMALASSGFSGAEIEQVIISALYDAFEADRDVITEDILNNIKETIPLSQTMEQEIARLRRWGRTHARPSSLADDLQPSPNRHGTVRQMELG